VFRHVNEEATAMEYLIGLSVLLIVGAVASVVGLRRGGGTSTAHTGLAAEAEANHWVVLLGESMVVPDARQWAEAGEGTGRALSSAMQCHRDARRRLAEARTADEYEGVARTAREGLRHVRVARAGLGLEGGVGGVVSAAEAAA
jgi:hypothetical protein